MTEYLFWAGHCSSTFDVAWELVRRNSLPVWGTVLADSQEAGRGQTRRTWVSPPGNLYVSFVLPSDIAVLGGMASLVTGYLVQRALTACGVSALLKWPNDILLELNGGQMGKVGGILLEEKKGVLLAGLGINLRHCPPPEQLRPDHSVSAASLAAYEYTPQTLWPKLLEHMRSTCAEHITAQPRAYIREQVEGTLAWKESQVLAGEPGQELRGLLTGLTDAGELCLRMPDGSVRTVDSGSVRQVEGFL